MSKTVKWYENEVIEVLKGKQYPIRNISIIFLVLEKNNIKEVNQKEKIAIKDAISNLVFEKKIIDHSMCDNDGRIATYSLS